MQCSKEVLAIVSMMSSEHPFHNSQKNKDKAKDAQRHFVNYDSDHITLLNIYRAYLEKPLSDQIKFCINHFLNPRSLINADYIHQQLMEYIKQLNMPLLSCGENYVAMKKALLAGLFPHVTKRQLNGQYKVLASGQLVNIHPSSVLHNLPHNKTAPPSFIVFN